MTTIFFRFVNSAIFLTAMRPDSERCKTWYFRRVLRLTHVSAIASEVPLHLPCFKHPASRGEAAYIHFVRSIPFLPARTRSGTLR